MYKKIVSVMLCVIIVVLVTVPAFAETKVQNVSFTSANVEVVDDQFADYEGTVISVSNLKTFDNREDAAAYLNDSITINNNPIIINRMSRATYGDVIVAQTNVSFGGTIILGLVYETSLNNHLGYVTKADPYSALLGNSIGRKWEEIYKSATIKSNGKDVYVKCNGVLVEYLLIDGLIELARLPVSLEGTAYCAR